jgi:hypothetical protein
LLFFLFGFEENKKGISGGDRNWTPSRLQHHVPNCRLRGEKATAL